MSTVDISRTGIPGGEIARLNTAPSLVGISLDGTQASAAGLAALTQFPKFQMLTIEDATDETALNLQLAGLPSLHFLTLTGEGVTDKSVAVLGTMTELQMLSLFKTSVIDPAQIQSLKDSLPNCQVQVFSEEDLIQLEKKFESDK